ncbi:MAG: diacylglycerol kinase family protein [Clostridium sp.]|nr:diacylglycerol kinase family protein [Clostridium sp.]MCM1444283.1 diacylglycerol kinase family protein [Candidatus Amulumruptor caecigallinarius]
MDLEFQKTVKKRGIKRFLNSFKYSVQGLIYAYKNEQSMTIHIIACIAVISLGIFLKISYFEWLVCFILFGLVMATELINTSIEALVDLVTKEYHPLAKIAKDTASAAVFVFSIVAFVSGVIIFLPKIIELL